MFKKVGKSSKARATSGMACLMKSLLHLWHVTSRLGEIPMWAPQKTCHAAMPHNNSSSVAKLPVFVFFRHLHLPEQHCNISWSTWWQLAYTRPKLLLEEISSTSCRVPCESLQSWLSLSFTLTPPYREVPWNSLQWLSSCILFTHTRKRVFRFSVGCQFPFSL